MKSCIAVLILVLAYVAYATEISSSSLDEPVKISYDEYNSTSLNLYSLNSEYYEPDAENATESHHSGNKHHNKELEPGDIAASIVIPITIVAFVMVIVTVSCIVAYKQGKLESLHLSMKKWWMTCKAKLKVAKTKREYSKTSSKDDKDTMLTDHPLDEDEEKNQL